MDWIDYREKLGLGFCDEDKVLYFLVKIFNFLDGLVGSMSTQIEDSEYWEYCNITGTSKRQTELYGDGYKLILQNLHLHSKTIEDFLSHYAVFINCQKDNKYKKLSCNDFKLIVCKMLMESHIQYEIIEDTDGVFIFPKGVPAFDDALVSETLAWLSGYPNAMKAWSKALRDYSEANEENASDVADKFRKALETLFQEFFGGGKSLENYKSEYGAFLKCKGIPKEISSNFETLLQSYTNYMNNYAKHRDATSDKVLEYLMYQTGNIMRLLITLKQEATNNAD